MKREDNIVTFDFDNYTDRLKRVIGIAIKEAKVRGDKKVTIDNITSGLVRTDPGVGVTILKIMGINLIEFVQTRRPQINSLEHPPEINTNLFNEDVYQVLEKARQEARVLGHDYIGTEHLVLGLLAHHNNHTALWLTAHGITLESVRKSLKDLLGAQ
jgi:ATP-dependent Clp protease ATP-binding subunit ClpC